MHDTPHWFTACPCCTSIVAGWYWWFLVLVLLVSPRCRHSLRFPAILVQCTPATFLKTSAHLVPGLPRCLCPRRGDHIADRYAHLVFCSLATWPPHFHFCLEARCATSSSLVISWILVLGTLSLSESPNIFLSISLLEYKYIFMIFFSYAYKMLQMDNVLANENSVLGNAIRFRLNFNSHLKLHHFVSWNIFKLIIYYSSRLSPLIGLQYGSGWSQGVVKQFIMVKSQ